MIYCIYATYRTVKSSIHWNLQTLFIDQKCTSKKMAKKFGHGQTPPPSFGQCPKENVFFQLTPSLMFVWQSVNRRDGQSNGKTFERLKTPLQGKRIQQQQRTSQNCKRFSFFTLIVLSQSHLTLVALAYLNISKYRVSGFDIKVMLKFPSSICNNIKRWVGNSIYLISVIRLKEKCRVMYISFSPSP